MPRSPELLFALAHAGVRGPVSVLTECPVEGLYEIVSDLLASGSSGGQRPLPDGSTLHIIDLNGALPDGFKLASPVMVAAHVGADSMLEDVFAGMVDGVAAVRAMVAQLATVNP